ncbi:VOC domain-containing protein [Balamuthia mandrillaris]
MNEKMIQSWDTIFRAADLLFSENRFDDRYDTLEQALEAHQFRFAKIVSTNEDEEGKKKKKEDGATLHALEHEVRSLGHPSFMRPLVNRIDLGFQPITLQSSMLHKVLSAAPISFPPQRVQHAPC